MKAYRRLACCGLLLWCCAAGAQSPAAAPQRVVSLNLCTDELLMLLAVPQQIASVTWLVKDPTLSWYAAQAVPYLPNRGLAEEILILQPDLVLAGSFTTPSTVALLRQLEVPLLQLPMATNLAAIIEQIRLVARALGRLDYAEQIIADMHIRLAQLPPLPQQAPLLTAALFQPNGLTATADTLVHAALQQAGLQNLAVVRDLPNYARLSLETLLYDQPDLLVLNDYLETTPSLAQQVMRHPALRKFFRGARSVVVPAQAWSCGTPNFVRAVELLRRAALNLMQHDEQAT